MSEAVPYRDADGRRNLLLGWSDGRVERVDAVTGEPVEPRMRGAGRAQAWSMTVFTGADGTTRLAAGDADGLLRVWDLETGRPVGGPVKAHNGPIARIVPYAVDGRSLLATGGTDHAVRIWDPETRTSLGEMMVQLDNTLGLCAYQVGGLAMLAVASDRLYRYDALTGQPVGEPIDGWDGDSCWGCAPAGPETESPYSGSTSAESGGSTVPPAGSGPPGRERVRRTEHWHRLP